MAEQLQQQAWQRLRGLRLAALADAPDAFGTMLAEAQGHDEAEWRAQLDTMATFVAVRDDQDVGLVRGAAAYDNPRNAYLLSLWVAPAARGCGVGDELVGAVVGWARAAAFERLLLDVGDHNTSAIALYARWNFLPTGNRGHLPAPRAHVREHERALVLEP